MPRSSVEGFFGEHAEAYSRSQSHAHGADLSALIDALAPRGDESGLDVATGTGFTAVALARHIKHVTAIDMTEEMLAEARKLALNEGVKNVNFELGDALRMGYADSSFDLVVTRRATHHFADVPRFLHEAWRVLADRGRLGIVDMSPPTGAEGFANRIERLRDSSHGQAFSPEAWERMVGEAGFDVVSAQVLEEQVPFARWLYPVDMGGDEERNVREAWRDTPDQVRALMKATFDGPDVVGWTKSRLILVASKMP